MSDDRKIEVVNGNGDDLEISPVYDHLDIEKPNTCLLYTSRCV